MNKEIEKMAEEACREANARFEKQKNYWNKQKLMQNGWTPELIKELLEEPDEINRFYGRSGHKYQEHLYRGAWREKGPGYKGETDDYIAPKLRQQALDVTFYSQNEKKNSPASRARKSWA
jgi:hypothetical protein